MGINGHTLTFEQKVLRRIEAIHMFDVNGVSEDEIRKYMDTKLNQSHILKIYSEVLEEVFAK